MFARLEFAECESCLFGDVLLFHVRKVPLRPNLPLAAGAPAFAGRPLIFLPGGAVALGTGGTDRTARREKYGGQKRYASAVAIAASAAVNRTWPPTV